MKARASSDPPGLVEASHAPEASGASSGCGPEARAMGPGVAEAPTMDAATMLPPELLQDNEIIILLIKPSPWYIVLEPLRTLLALFAMACLTSLAPADWLVVDRRDLMVGWVAAIGVRLFWQFLEWLSRIYVLTDRRVIRVAGVLRIAVFESPLENIQNTQALYSIRERMFGLGTITFATAGTGAVEAVWRMVSQPLEVHKLVVSTMRRYRR